MLVLEAKKVLMVYTYTCLHHELELIFDRNANKEVEREDFTISLSLIDPVILCEITVGKFIK